MQNMLCQEIMKDRPSNGGFQSRLVEFLEFEFVSDEDKNIICLDES